MHLSQYSDSLLQSAQWSFAKAKLSYGEKAGLFPPHFDPAHDVSQLEWQPAQTPPTEIFTDLLNAKLISHHPFKQDFDEQVQWVGETDWIYRAVFNFDKAKNNTVSELVFEGLDTYASIWLNGTYLRNSDNAFIAIRIPVHDVLVDGSNELLLYFSSAFLRGKDIQKDLGKLIAWNGDPSRVYVRKPQYHYGWDWGPTLLTTGPWKPVKLATWSICKLDKIMVKATAEVVQEVVKPSLSVTCDVSKVPDPQIDLMKVSIAVHITDLSNDLKVPSLSKTKKLGASDILNLQWSHDELSAVALWWPNGYGNQNLYNVEIKLIYDDDDSTVLDSRVRTVGFKSVELVQRPLQGKDGESFFFKINNMPTYIAGCNWIPADSFLTNISNERYRKWLTLAAKANFNLIRVWGGGCYEPQSFYDMCDELGLLVWQDFMFGCGIYPAHKEFVESVKKEVEQVVESLCSHASLAIYAGNNEDYMLAEMSNISTSDDKKFPARKIYEDVMKKQVERVSPYIPYIPSSPWGGKSHGTNTLDPTIVWHGSQERYQDYDKLTGRFVSEFGMQGYPDVKTINYWVDGNNEEKFPQSRMTDHHNKADGFERRIALYITENFRYSFDMEGFTYVTQLMQAEALSSAYSQWKREWRGEHKEYNAGTVVWQLNDCWPCVSWSIVDYFIRPKPSYFAIKRACAQVTIGVKRYKQDVHKNDRTGISNQVTKVDIWASNASFNDVKVKFVVEACRLNSGEIIQDKGVIVNDSIVELKKNQTTELYNCEWPLEFNSDDVVLLARLRDIDSNETISRYQSYAEPFKYIKFPTPDETKLQIDIQQSKSDQGNITISANRPVKGLVFSNPINEIDLLDNALDIFPTETQVISFAGNSDGVQWRYLGDDKCR